MGKPSAVERRLQNLRMPAEQDFYMRADDGIRTRDPHLGKVMLYQLSHVRVSGRLRYQSPAETDNGMSTGTALARTSTTIPAQGTRAPRRHRRSERR